MKEMIRLEFYRCFHNKKFWVSLLIGSLITVSHFVTEILLKQFSTYEELLKYGDYPQTVFNNWIGNSGSLQSALFFMLFPLLAAYPYGDSFYHDMKSGYIKNLFIRTKKGNYFLAKFVAVFFSAGIVVTVPLLLNLWLTMMTLPSLPPEITTGTFSIFSNDMWSELFLNSPYLYNALYLLLIFVFTGLFTCLCLPFSYWLINSYLVLLIPFIINVCLCALTNCSNIAPYTFLNPEQSSPANPWIILLETIVLILAVGIGYFYYGVKNHVVS